MKIALAQILSEPNPDDNLQQIQDNAVAGAKEGADLIVFPEATMCAFGNDLSAIAQPLDGHWANAVRSIAQELDVVLVVGMFTPGDANRVRNTLLVTGRGIDTHYDKIHLFDAFGHKESDSVEPGKHRVIFEMNGVRIGLATCYDLRFPNLFTQNAQDGVQLHIVPTSWGDGVGKAEQLDLLTRARALDSTAYLVCADQAHPKTVYPNTPESSLPTGIGRSSVVNPLGQDVVRLDDQPALRTVEILPDTVDETRAKVPVLVNQKRVNDSTFVSTSN